MLLLNRTAALYQSIQTMMKSRVLVQLPGANAGKPDVAGAAKQAVKKSPVGFMQVGDLADGNLIEQVMYSLHSIYSVTEVHTLDSTPQLCFIGGLVICLPLLTILLTR